MATYSILIRGGMIFRDKKLERADIGISDDKIQKIGDLSRYNGMVVIDAAGRYVSPGFVDLSAHSDTHWTLFNHPSQESLLVQGVTTILGGNCGASLAPLVRAQDIEGIGKWADVREININWQNLAEFFEELSRHPLGVNFATLVGHGTLRRSVLGGETRAATHAETDQMRLLLERSLGEGAFGLSTNLGASHGRPADENELAELFSIVRAYGGLTKHHLKDEGKNILPALVQLIQLARETRAKIHFSHFKILGRSAWHLFHDALKVLESAREDGFKLTLDFFPYTRTGSQLYLFLPPWALEGGRDKILAYLGEAARREEIKAYLKSLTLHYERITIASTLEDRTAVGKTIGDLSSSSGLSPEEVLLRLVETNQLKVSIFNEVISSEHLSELAKKEYAAVASDGVGYAKEIRLPFDLPHPRSYGAFPRALEIFSKETNALPWAELIYKMTELPAEILGLKGRGKLAEGFFADITVFDPEAVRSAADYNNPYIFPEGIEWVLVNGKVGVERGIFNGRLAGKILKRI
ncbi:MAG: amidohydrolase family protein [bacterium]|nr:amidohydrolase family protein [bacterium]